MGKLAALSSGLLARKGQARPAMRPQVFGHFNATDDLGWNDMGDPSVPAPAPPPPLPPVLVARAELETRVEAPEPEPVAEAAPEPVAEPVAPMAVEARRSVSVATATRIRRETTPGKKGGKAAFTLRLDPERHLKLRLASALADRSAQALVTDALDHMLAAIPEVEALIAQLPEAKRR